MSEVSTTTTSTDADVAEVATAEESSTATATAPQSTKRSRATERDKKLLNDRAAKVRELEQSITKMQKVSLAEALKIGEHLLWAKQELLRVNAGIGFKQWIVKNCKMTYKRGYNYMRLVKAAAINPKIKDMGLTEAYVLLGLVRRKDLTPAAGDAAKGGAGGDSGDSGDGDEPITRRIASFELIRERDVYVLEVAEETFQDTLMAVIADADNLVGVLKEGGLLIKLSTPADDAQVETDDGDSSADSEEDGGDEAPPAK